MIPLFPDLPPPTKPPRKPRRKLYPILDAGDPGFAIPANTRWIKVNCPTHGETWGTCDEQEYRHGRAECPACRDEKEST